MTPSNTCYKMVERFEGYRPAAYQDGNGVWTIGYGHTQGVKPGDRCTTAQAQEWLAQDMATAAHAVNEYVTVPLTQNQYDALVSLVYNIGAGNFRESTLLRKLNDKDYGGASEQFLAWRRVGSDKSALLPRRSQERTLFDTP